ncbi:hypothetical protein AKJ64_04155 [candidate division MSBL1 archaeon SCGC-AAA259E17]|uniref:Uncharacterized protein n=1 Tax=candidate division MSBL1 archaeon SCGC-AAA259E17 TaxID=1698263 RepID=A0A133UCY5_9EURY|nr:hypothetical protein AKJ64_04155 [candidate division MSBL1 archaeon SCGC-AAA259E17]
MLGKNPGLSADEWRESGMKPSLGTICRRFGSWNEARRKAGLDVTEKDAEKYSEEEILDALRDHPNLTMEEWKEKGLEPSWQTIAYRFGSWNEARKAAGLTPRKSPKKKRDREKVVREAMKTMEESDNEGEIRGAQDVLRRYARTYLRLRSDLRERGK